MYPSCPGMSKAETIQPPHSAYASACHTVRTKDGTVRVVQHFRGLNALLKEQSGGSGNLPTIIDEVGGSKCFTCLGLASGLLQITIHKSDGHLTAFRDENGKLWECVRCGRHRPRDSVSGNNTSHLVCRFRRRRPHP